MPIWLQVIVWASAGLAAVGVIWRKLVRPGARVVSKAEQLLPLFDDLHVLVPLLQDLTEQFEGSPDSFKILKEIASQFRTDSGSTLRDVVNRIEAVAEANAAATRENKIAAQVIAADLEAERRLGEQGRQQVSELIELVRVFGAKLSVQGVQLDAQDVAAAGIADDLDASHRRAEAHDREAPPGAASDSAMRREEEP